MTEAAQRIVIAAGHAIFRAAVRALLVEEAWCRIVGEADCGHDAVIAVGRLDAQLVLLDLAIGGMSGLEATAELKRRYPAVRTIVMTERRDDDEVSASLGAGAHGYLLKNATPDELRFAVRSVALGKTYLHADVAANVVRRLRQDSRGERPERGFEALTQRELEILKLVAEGMSNRAIADITQRSVKTIEKHRGNLMNKLELRNAAALTACAIKHGLIGAGADATRPPPAPA